MEQKERMRLFVAVELSDEQKHGVYRFQQKLKGYLDGVRWVRPEGLHLTLKFLGETEAGRVRSIKEAMDKIAGESGAFDLTFGGVGVFPSPARARVIWVGLENGADPAIQLAEKFESALVFEGFKKEKRKYSPHLTIGRLRYPLPEDRVKKFLDREAVFRTSTVKVREAVLFESILSRHGAEYKALYRAGFKEG